MAQTFASGAIYGTLPGTCTVCGPGTQFGHRPRIPTVSREVWQVLQNRKQAGRQLPQLVESVNPLWERGHSTEHLVPGSKAISLPCYMEHQNASDAETIIMPPPNSPKNVKLPSQTQTTLNQFNGHNGTNPHSIWGRVLIKASLPSNQCLMTMRAMKNIWSRRSYHIHLHSLQKSGLRHDVHAPSNVSTW